MEIGQIIELINAVSDSNLTEFNMQDGELKISMETNKKTEQMTVTAPFIESKPEMTAGVQNMDMAAQPVTGDIVKSPLVGTFYQSSSPEAAPYVKVGDTVKKGQTLGIVEAMKLMNEIESEFDGTVKEILVKNEQLVEFGQPMFVIG